MTTEYDIIIAYRCYPGISKTPIFFTENKLDMIKNGLKSMISCLGKLKAKFIIIADGCPDIFENEIKGTLDGYDVEYIKTNRIGNLPTFKMQLDLLTKQDDAEIVYIAEDDYLYNIKDINGFEEGIELLKKGTADFVTLFDHLGCYVARHHSIKAKYHITKNRIWKTIPSTCLTFMTTKKTLLKTKSVLGLYSKGCLDHSMRLTLTKYNLFRLFDIAKYKVWGIPSDLIYLAMAWIYGFKQIVFGRKYKLFAPIPSIATHLESTDIAPLVDRNAVKKQIGE